MRYWPVESLRQSKPWWFIPETDEKANTYQVIDYIRKSFQGLFYMREMGILYSDALGSTLV